MKIIHEGTSKKGSFMQRRIQNHVKKEFWIRLYHENLGKKRCCSVFIVVVSLLMTLNSYLPTEYMKQAKCFQA